MLRSTNQSPKTDNSNDVNELEYLEKALKQPMYVY